MSSLTRKIQRAVKRDVFYGGRGARLGTVNPQDKSKLAREARELNRSLKNG